MRYFFIFILLFFNTALQVVGSGGNVFGQNHFSDLLQFVAGGPIRIDFMPYLPMKPVEKKKIGFNVIWQYANSTKDNKLSQFFIPDGNLLLTVTGGPDYFIPGPLPASQEQPNNKVVRNIDALVLGITDPDFSSIIELTARSVIKYAGFFGYYVFLFNKNNTPKLSFEIALPIVNCFRKTMGQETIYKKGDAYADSPVKTALDGLSRDLLKYQRWNFSANGMSETRAPNIEFDLSYNYLPTENCSVETYLGCLVPLSKGCDKKNKYHQFVFAPEFANSQHVGLQYGTTISLFLYENDERSIKFLLGSNFLYFFPKNHFRSFDLQGRSWSKYLTAYQNFQLKNQQMEPLVNFLSFECRVSPNFSTIATTEFHYIRDSFDIGIGYCLFARQSESVTILEDLPNIVLKGTDINTNITEVPPVSIARGIALRLQREDLQTQELDTDTNKLRFNANYFYAKIDNTIVDVASATHPAVFSGELYLKASTKVFNLADILLGASYRFSHNNTAIEYATFWVGLQMAF